MSSSPAFQTGDRVYCVSRRTRGEVIGLQQGGSRLFYRVDLATGVRVTVTEEDLERSRSPLERLAAGECGYASEFDLLTQATALEFAYRYEGMSCLSNSRLDPLPYQVFVAHRALQDLYPRYLLADEVGLGKTIEAGLILKELKARGLARRILIIVPASLREQWQGEMEVKFNERFYIYDRHHIEANRQDHKNRNPWEVHDQVIVSLQYARQQTRHTNQLKRHRGRRAVDESRCIDAADWDLVIFDEAHHLRRYLRGSTLNSEREVTLSYRLGQSLADRVRSLLLLTATPMQLHRYETYSLLELLDPSLYESYSIFTDSVSRTATLARLERFVTDFESGVFSEPGAAGSEMAGLFVEFLDTMYSFREHGNADTFWEGLAGARPGKQEADTDGSWQQQVAQLRDSCMVALDGLVSYFHGYSSKIPESYNAALREFWTFVASHHEAVRRWAETQHVLSRIMIRNRKREVLKGEFVQRRAHRIGPRSGRRAGHAYPCLPGEHERGRVSRRPTA